MRTEKEIREKAESMDRFINFVDKTPSDYKQVEFSTLTAGNIFVCHGDIYICINDSHAYTVNAINLANGEGDCFVNEMVYPLKATLNYEFIKERS